MKYALVFLIGLLVGGGGGAGVYFVMQRQPKKVDVPAGTPELAVLKSSVTQRLRETTADIKTRLSAFCKEVAGDQLFSLRLLVENNPTAPEVTNKACQFLKPMGFSLLEIADSGYTLISCGQFPASVGNSVASKGELLSGEPAVLIDRVMSGEVLSYQAKCAFTIAESITFYAMGGMVIDNAWLKRLSPREGVTVLLKQGATVLGLDKVRTISEVKDGKIIINDKEYAAVEIPLASVGSGEIPHLIAVLK
jgi:hypothetical protein